MMDDDNNNNKLVLWSFLQDNPGETAPEQSAVLDFTWLQKVLLTFSPHADPIPKYTGWLTCQQTIQKRHTYKRRADNDPQYVIADDLPVTTLPINLGLGLLVSIPQCLDTRVRKIKK